MVEPARPLFDDDTTALVEAVRAGIAAVDAGRTAPYEAVRHWLLSWGTEAELPPCLAEGDLDALQPTARPLATMESNRDAG